MALVVGANIGTALKPLLEEGAALGRSSQALTEWIEGFP